MAGLVRLRCRQDEKRRPRGQSPMAPSRAISLRRRPASPPTSPPVQRQPTPMNLPLSSSVPQPVKSPHQSPYTSGIHSAKAPYRGNRPARAKPVHRPSEPPSNGEMGERLTMTVPIVVVHLGRWLRAPDRLVVSVRWWILMSIRGTQYNANPARYGRFIGQGIAGSATPAASNASLK